MFISEPHFSNIIREIMSDKARIFLLVDLRDFFRIRVWGTKKGKKSSENDQ